MQDSSALVAPQTATLAPPELPPEVAAASQPYIGKWNRLVSTTNWEKGRIICEWRQSLENQAAAAGYSDEAWATLVGGVTGQHVGRLRRVYQRFGQAAESYTGLYWSHFQAALDWQDAEMWLEGAVQNGWSVAKMRHQRWDTLGGLEADRPQPGEVVTNETDEDFEPARTSDPSQSISPADQRAFDGSGPAAEGPDFGDEFTGGPSGSDWADNAPAQTPAGEPVALLQPFADLPPLPDDLQDAVESLKLAILHHKSAGWTSVDLSAVLQTLDALKGLAAAPSDASPAPF